MIRGKNKKTSISYQKIKNEPHIFIYSVYGRTSSTALQRFINSSNEICIFGEPESMGINNLFLNAIHKLEKDMDRDQYRKKLEELELLKNCYRKNKHKLFYPNAINDLSETVEKLKDLYCNAYKPPIPVKRIGFKEITVPNENDITRLHEFFPKSHILFIFRDPVEQFRSVNKCKYFPYSNDVNHFLKEYERISNIYLQHNTKHNNQNFIENIRLYSINDLDKLFKHIEISGFDETLIGKKVNSTSDHELSDEILETIETSKAKENYLRMKIISKNFFTSL